ncbi:hypothetical protein [Bacillus horti]|uniref:4-amino-4-deoxy-L-arabinose transferase-like glycosyltransferase n=1 Tax=Caldalkalibacillus horti TaxID=77523 RepID=A0ABT9W1Q4_9BACI|nr:hypothetical protein [Bacillus horti]MDQ0167185.1 4-amino-4-deoxy-L-arabinose transferase-like glycosyltransferase [Bacillus horti]
MDQLLLWASASTFNYIITIFVLGPLPFVLVYLLLKRKFSKDVSTLIAAIIVYVPVFTLLMVTIDNPPYFLFSIMPIAVILYFLLKRKYGTDIATFVTFIVGIGCLIGFQVVTYNNFPFLYIIIAIIGSIIFYGRIRKNEATD